MIKRIVEGRGVVQLVQARGLIDLKLFARSRKLKFVNFCCRCWLESSFVGTKPVDSPQTPALDKPNYVPAHQQRVNIGPMSMTATNYDSYRMNGGGESTMI